MNVDYKELCNELFGTTDVEQLKKIALKVNKKNNRGAGRKKAFSSEQINEMREMQAQNIPQQKIAEHFGTSRQTISKYLREPFMINTVCELILCIKHLCAPLFSLIFGMRK